MRSAKRHPRPAYTLLELILVLAIIVLAAGVTVPVIQSMLADAHETAAGDMVRGMAAEARAHAMETSQSWRLAYLPATGAFQLAPEGASDWDGSDQTPTEKDGLLRVKLPGDIVFMDSPGIAQATQGAPVAPSSQALPGGTPTATDGWQTIAVFLYDGSARDGDSLTYFGKTGTPPMAIQVRGLTGSVSVLSAKEVMDTQP